MTVCQHKATEVWKAPRNTWRRYLM